MTRMSSAAGATSPAGAPHATARNAGAPHATARNATFSWLEAILILMVIDDHAMSTVGALTGLFPYDSFFMPAFVFVSGYFYRWTNFGAFVKKKVRKQLVKYLFWCLVGFAISVVLDHLLGFHWCEGFFKLPLARSLETVLFNGTPSTINGPAWFLIMLFWVEIAYAVLQLLIQDDRRLNYVTLVALVALSCTAAGLCMQGVQYHGPRMSFLLRESFYLVFLHLGHMFRLYWEDGLKRLPMGRICLICVLINCALISFLGLDSITFPKTEGMVVFHSPFLPLVTSATGTLFWYEIARFLAGSLGETPAVSFVSRNTGTIMQTHLFGICLPVIIQRQLVLAGVSLPGVGDIDAITHDAWGFSASGMPDMVLFACGLGFSLLVCWLLERVKARRVVAEN